MRDWHTIWRRVNLWCVHVCWTDMWCCTLLTLTVSCFPATMCHAQIIAISGWSLLLFPHVLTYFVLIELGHSVRAHSNINFQRMQMLTRMSPRLLLDDNTLMKEFEDLCTSVLSWKTSWDNIYESSQQLYVQIMPAFEAAQVFVDQCQAQFQHGTSRKCGTGYAKACGQSGRVFAYNQSISGGRNVPWPKRATKTSVLQGRAVRSHYQWWGVQPVAIPSGGQSSKHECCSQECKHPTACYSSWYKLYWCWEWCASTKWAHWKKIESSVNGRVKGTNSQLSWHCRKEVAVLSQAQDSMCTQWSITGIYFFFNSSW